MSYRIENIELYVRETQPARMLVLLGKQKRDADWKQELINPLGHVRLVLKDSGGATTFGCSGDRLSVRWLDKRPGRSKGQKRRELVQLIETAREIYLAHPEFDSPFELWHRCHPQVMKAGRGQGQEDLTSSFASALMERAVLDAVCRMSKLPIFEMVRQDRIGFRPAQVHSELEGLNFTTTLPERPPRELFIRHTVGLADPLTAGDLPAEKRLGDGLPETLEEYIQADGLRYFKIKISGDAARDLARLERIWDVVVRTEEPMITLDANEAYGDLDDFTRFVDKLGRDLTGLFQHIEYIEQPLPRRLSLDPKSEPSLRKIAEAKPLIIDEADATLDAFKRAHKIGYQGTSHKNCKGFFKSLLNRALAVHFAMRGKEAFLSAEDLQNLPVVPLHQDFATVAILGLEHCERNGHHYNYGLSMLSPKDKAAVVKGHPDMYVKRGDEWFLDVREGRVHCGSLQCPGFGVRDEPDWASMSAIREWVKRRHPAS